MISFDDALALVKVAALPLGPETVALGDAHGRILAAPCIAQITSPAGDVSAMDGYALRDQDLSLSTPFEVVGTAFPGTPFEGTVRLLECVRVFTGALIPGGADRVVVQEEVQRDGSLATMLHPSTARRHIRQAGLDFAAGDALLPAGRRLDPQAIVAAAGADLDELEVWRRPRISILGTGDELLPPGSARLRRFAIPESISYGVAALAETWGAQIIGRHRISDDIATITHAAGEAARSADLVIMTGGASVGERDFSKQAFIGLGAEILFPRVLMKPGKPVWFGRLGTTLVLGLPGNPSSAMVTARLFLTTLLAGLTGREPSHALQWRRARLASPLPSTGVRETFLRAYADPDGIVKVDNQDSGMQLELANATLLVRQTPNSPALAAGEMVDVIDF
ncbi:molybdopterin molybdotransferase [Sphingobium sp. AP50]|uniref:molybdopterin molybdotransferase MoeA n=1 Tax=Sphingobium sp. AP50 TaxID=1884369 RepID=UPI0008B946A2|nr:molybdopterin molybdotransferase MoeA [Sphingobium sp. AP50]SEJ82142.1 molybdopterin molybdotransferase [Sphingobium sp. AP50]